MSKIVKKMKIMQPGGTLSDYVPIGAEAENINVDGESVETKLGKKPYYYDTVADMKADTKLKVGDMAVTLGYHSVNDGGAAEYNIIDDSGYDNNYYEELNNGLLAELIYPKNITACYGSGKKAFYNCLNNSNEIILTENLEIPANELTITTSKNIDLNGHNITMSVNSINYSNLITINTTGEVTIKNGKINGNYENHTLDNPINHTGILCNSGNLILENMEIYNCYFEGLILNGPNSKVTVENCYLHHNGRNEIALLNWLYFKCNNSKFGDDDQDIDPLANICIEPYEANSNMGMVEVTNCLFESNLKKYSIETYVNMNQTKNAQIIIKNNIFYNTVKLGYDQGRKSTYILENNKYIDIENKSALLLTETIENVTIKDLFDNCEDCIKVDLFYTWGVIKNINIDCILKGTINKAIEFIVPEGNLTYDYPFDTFNININSNKIINWKYLHNSKITTPPLIATDNVTLDFNNYYSEIYMTGYSKTISIDGIYYKSKNISPRVSIYSDVSNIISSTLLPTINSNVGNNGISIPSNNSSFKITIHNHNYNKFIIDELIGIYNARTI